MQYLPLQVQYVARKQNTFLLEGFLFQKCTLRKWLTVLIRTSDIIRNSGKVKDLGFKFNTELDPSDHIGSICCIRKAPKTLGLIMRLAHGYLLGYSVKSLLCGLCSRLWYIRSLSMLPSFGILTLLITQGRLKGCNADSLQVSESSIEHSM